jgi:hypothetical protein
MEGQDGWLWLDKDVFHRSPLSMLILPVSEFNRSYRAPELFDPLTHNGWPWTYQAEA